MIHQINRTQQLNCDISTAWKFFSSPHNLSKITPPEMKFTVLSEGLSEHIFKGMTIDYKVSPLLGIPMNWQTLITQVNEEKDFTDTQVKGPYKLWRHFHEFIPNEAGVLMKDTVDYELPFGIMGDITNTLLVGKKVESIFDFRNQVLEKLFNTQHSYA